MPSFFTSLKFYSKTVLAGITLSVCAIYGVIASAILTLIGQKRLAQWTTARCFYHLFSFIFRIRINIENPERLENLPAIIISNHQSELDILILGRIFPRGCTVTAKKQLKYIPFLGQFMSLSGTFFLDRADRSKAVETLNNALSQLKKSKRGLFMFPEGTRSYSNTPTLLPFKKGAFHLAVQAGIPIIPVCVSNTSTIMNGKAKNFNTGVIDIKVLEPIDTKGLTKDDVNDLVEATRTKMLDAINEIGYSKVGCCRARDVKPSSQPSESTHLLNEARKADVPVGTNP